MKGITILAALCVSAAAVPALAAPRAAETASTAAAANSDERTPAKVRPAGTRYCYDTEQTGTRLSKRICMTRADWAREGVTVPAGL